MADGTGIFIGSGAGGTPQLQLELKRANRHGLIAGATGTGKTVTIQGIIDGLSQAGVPCFVADVKGDLSGLAMAGSPTSKLHETFAARAKEIGFVHETGDLDAEAKKIIDAILGGAPTAQARGKKLILDIVNRPVDESMIKLTVTQIAEARAAEEGKEGLSAFLNKTEPKWRRK